MTDPIYHLAEPEEWTARSEHYSPPSVESEGFVHCSTAEQLPRVAAARFAGRTDLILLTIDPDQLEPGTLIYEDSYGAGEEFPHIYGALPVSAVLSTGPYGAHLENET